MQGIKVILEDVGDGSQQKALVDFLFSGETIDTSPEHLLLIDLDEGRRVKDIQPLTESASIAKYWISAAVDQSPVLHISGSFLQGGPVRWDEIASAGLGLVQNIATINSSIRLTLELAQAAGLARGLQELDKAKKNALGRHSSESEDERSMLTSSDGVSITDFVRVVTPTTAPTTPALMTSPAGKSQSPFFFVDPKDLRTPTKSPITSPSRSLIKSPVKFLLQSEGRPDIKSPIPTKLFTD